MILAGIIITAVLAFFFSRSFWSNERQPTDIGSLLDRSEKAPGEVYSGQNEIMKLISESQKDLGAAGYDHSKNESENFVALVMGRLNRQMTLIDEIAATGSEKAKIELAQLDMANAALIASDRNAALNYMRRIESMEKDLRHRYEQDANRARFEEKKASEKLKIAHYHRRNAEANRLPVDRSVEQRLQWDVDYWKQEAEANAQKAQIKTEAAQEIARELRKMQE